MQNQNLFLRNDTFLGVCEAIGTDFGFHANWLRVAFAFALFFSPAVTAGVYLTLGFAVAIARWFYPASVGSAATDSSPAEGSTTIHGDNEQQELPLAA
jgi:phage shock protein PspC (stress-responsive transcriptional regulator)